MSPKIANGASISPGTVHVRDQGRNLSGKDLHFTLAVASQLLDVTNYSRKRIVWPAGLSSVAPTTFSSVGAGDRFASDTAWMAMQGINKGWAETDGSTEYRHLQPVNRDAMAALMHRLEADYIPFSPKQAPLSVVAQDQPFYFE